MKGVHGLPDFGTPVYVKTERPELLTETSHGVCVCVSECVCERQAAGVPTWHTPTHTRVSKQTNTRRHTQSPTFTLIGTHKMLIHVLSLEHTTLNICKGHIKQQCNCQFKNNNLNINELIDLLKRIHMLMTILIIIFCLFLCTYSQRKGSRAGCVCL